MRFIRFVTISLVIRSLQLEKSLFPKSSRTKNVGCRGLIQLSPGCVPWPLGLCSAFLFDDSMAGRFKGLAQKSTTNLGHHRFYGIQNALSPIFPLFYAIVMLFGWVLQCFVGF